MINKMQIHLKHFCNIVYLVNIFVLLNMQQKYNYWKQEFWVIFNILKWGFQNRGTYSIVCKKDTLKKDVTTFNIKSTQNFQF